MYSFLVIARVLSSLPEQVRRGAPAEPGAPAEGSSDAALLEQAQQAPPWGYAALAGRVVQLSGHKAGAVLSATVSVVWQAQRAGEPCAWITRRESTFFPPDVARYGVDLASLVMVAAPTVQGVLRAGARLARSGGFGVVVMEVGALRELGAPLQGRLSKLALEHRCAVIFLTESPAQIPSLGSMISLRVEAQRVRKGATGFALRLMALKDKRGAPGWGAEEERSAPAGLC